MHPCVHACRRSRPHGGIEDASEFCEYASGKYHFNLKASNGEVIASSENYETKRNALAGIESVK